MHLTAFGMILDKEQARIDRLRVVISDEDKLQFYIEQIYASNCFDKKEMVDWENKPVNIKDDYDEAKLYFEGLVQDFETYIQNSGGDSGKRGYESANQMADVALKSGNTSRILPVLQSPPTKKQPNLQPTSAKSQGLETPSFKQ